MSEKRVKHYVVEWKRDGMTRRLVQPTRKDAWRYYWSLPAGIEGARVIRIVEKPRRDTTVETLKWCHAMCQNVFDLNNMAKAIEGRLRILDAWEGAQ